MGKRDIVREIQDRVWCSTHGWHNGRKCQDLKASRISEVKLIFTDFSWFHGVALLPHTFRRSSFGSGGRRLLYRTQGCNVLAVKDYLDVQKVRETNRQSEEKVRMRAEVFLNFLIFPDTSRWP